jgi:hypothetical protein
MANTTFNRPVRSENGFEVVTKNNTTGSYITRQAAGLPDMTGMAAASLATGANITLGVGTPAGSPGIIEAVNYTGAAACAVALPAAISGTIAIYVQSIDTTGGTATLTFNAAGTDVWATGSVIESRAGNAVTHDISTVGETTLVFTPAAVTTNLLTTGGTIAFICYTTGTWNIAYRLGGAGTAVTGVFAFAA